MSVKHSKNQCPTLSCAGFNVRSMFYIQYKVERKRSVMQYKWVEKFEDK